MKAKILVIEDERHIAEGIKINLELSGYEVRLAVNGKEGLKLWTEFNPNLILLDIMMPEIDGHGVLSRIRESDEKLPILILSAKNASVDKVKAFKSGVDDYLGKPFSVDELLLRVERLLLRSSWNKPYAENQVFEFGQHKVDLSILKAYTNKGEVDLTDQETKILTLFFQNPQKVLKRSQLLEAGWGYSEEVQSRTLDNFMVRLRRYFEEDPKNPKYFCSVRGVGYLFNPEGQGR